MPPVASSEESNPSVEVKASKINKNKGYKTVADFKAASRGVPHVALDFGENPPLKWVQVKDKEAAAQESKNVEIPDDPQQLKSLITMLANKLNKTSSPKSPGFQTKWVLRPDVQRAKCIRTIAVERAPGNKLYYASTTFHRGKSHHKMESDIGGSEASWKQGEEIFRRSDHFHSCLGRLLTCPVVIQLDKDTYSNNELIDIARKALFHRNLKSHNKANRNLKPHEFFVSATHSDNVTTVSPSILP